MADRAASGGHRAPPAALAVSGLDPSGGAGLLADASVLGMLRVRALGAATCLTAQSRARFQGAWPVEVGLLERQIVAALEEEEVRAVKVGWLPDPLQPPAVARALAAGAGPRSLAVVVDPVLAATLGGGGECRAGEDSGPAACAAALRRHLLPECALATPNLPELSALVGADAAGDPEAAARSLLGGRLAAVLVKGGHGPAEGPEVVDLLVLEGETRRLAHPRQEGPEVHGTGCALSAAAAGYLALGRALVEAVEEAVALVQELRRRAEPPLGPGGLARLPLADFPS